MNVGDGIVAFEVLDAAVAKREFSAVCAVEIDKAWGGVWGAAVVAAHG